MWKYLTKKDSINFLLSLNLIDNNNPLKTLYSISNNIENNYNIYKIKKNNNKLRTVYEPKSNLKHVQRMILSNILENKMISKYAKAYKKGLSLRDNALPHVNKKIILKLDIEHFFDNITFYRIYESCFSIEYFPKEIGILLTCLCTYNGFLPQGSPTSSYVSNLVMLDFDNEIGLWCDNNGINYTRYSDDMTFSGNFDPKIIINKVKRLLNKMELKLNVEKIKVINKCFQQNVTGVVVNNKVQVALSYRKKIRQEIYYINKYGITHHLMKIKWAKNKNDYLKSLKGKINYVLQIDNNNKEFLNYLKIIKELTKC